MKGVTLKKIKCKICNQLVDPRGIYSHSKKHKNIKIESNGLVKSEKDIMLWIPIDREFIVNAVFDKIAELVKKEKEI